MNSLPSFLLRPQICPRVSLSFPQVYLVTPYFTQADLTVCLQQKGQESLVFLTF
jgi:hypothetical protein